MPPELTHKGLPIRRNSLVARMCKWVDEGYYINKRAKTLDCVVRWEMVLRSVRTTNLLRNGYKNLTNPSLHWLFKGPRGYRAIDNVVAGNYEYPEAPQLKQARRARRLERKEKRRQKQVAAQQCKEQQSVSSGEQASCDSLDALGVMEVTDGSK